MKKYKIVFFTSKFEQIEHAPVYEWLLETARSLGILRGIAVKGIAGFGPEGRLLEEQFFEMGSDLPVEVSFIVDEEEKKALLNTIEKQPLSISYTTSSVEHITLRP